MYATATKTENDGRQWFKVEFIPTSGHDDALDLAPRQYGLTTDGDFIEADGRQVGQNNVFDSAAIRAIESSK